MPVQIISGVKNSRYLVKIREVHGTTDGILGRIALSKMSKDIEISLRT